MTFKDLLRLLRRRGLTAGSVFVLVFLGFVAFSTLKERPMFRARARILITTPPLFVNAQTNQWVAIETKDINTWTSIIRSGKVLGPARLLLEKVPGARPEWLDSITVTGEGQQLIWIEATAPTPHQAAAVANAVAEATVSYEKSETGKELKEGIAKTQKLIDKEKGLQEKELAAARRERDAAKARLSADSLELDIRKLQEDTLAHEGRRRDVERRLSTNRLRVERISSDRSVAEHLQREISPRTASAQLRVYENPRVREASEQLEGLHRRLNTLRRRYTEEHPEVKNARGDLRDAELFVTRTQIEALGRDMDGDELAIRADTELGAIELRVLEPELRELRGRLEALRPFLDRTVAHERLAADAKARQATLENQRAQFETAPESPSYVRELDAAKPEEAAAVELRLRKSWPVALLAGIIMGLSFAFLLDFVDTSIRTDYDVRRHLDFPVLAVVPKVAADEILTVRAAPASIVAEIFDTLATVLLSTAAPQPPKIFLVTSTNPQEGKTAVSIDLAVALARQGKHTLLVDGDMRVPAIHSSLGLPNDLGLSAFLAGQVTLGTEGLLYDIAVPNLQVMTSGLAPENPYELLDPARIAGAAAQMREQFDAVVVDTPPVLRTGDALKFSTAADSVLFVVESGKTDQRQATWAKRLLANVNAKVAGVLLNRAQREGEEYYSYYGGGRRGSRREVRV